MADHSQRTTVRVDEDGVRVVETGGVRSGVWLLVAAMALVMVAIVLVVRPFLSITPTPPAPVGNLQALAPTAAGDAKRSSQARPAGPGAAVAPRRAPDHETQRAAPEARPAAAGDAGAAPESNAPAAADEAAAPGTEPEEKPGIAVFPPPGTKPIKRGILVPEDFELPAGYVRHYQATDNGERVPAILMFHPDYQPLDDHGQPIPLPDDRVVPPDMAPPGMPVQMLDVPANDVPMIEQPPGE